MPARPASVSPFATSGDGGFHLTNGEFERVRAVLQDQFGIAVDASKRSLIEAKVAKLVRNGGHDSFARYEAMEMQGPRPSGLSSFIDQLTTNHTFFWREPAHFEFMRGTVLPELEQRLNNSKDLRVWCAVSSTGEEAWTMAMLLKQHFGSRYHQWKAGVLATDISSRALASAVDGIYDASAVERLPAGFVSQFFRKKGPGVIEVAPDLRREVLFRRLNLMTRPLPFRQPMHIVFCRNVMIYFDQQTNRELAQTIYNHMAPGGYLFVGHSEPLDRSTCPFEIVGSSIYRKPL